MLKNEKDKFVVEILKKLWWEWNWGSAIRSIWYRTLNDFEYSISKEAAENVYATGEIKFQRQILPLFIREAKLLQQRTVQAERKEKGIKPNEMVIAYYYRCTSHVDKPFYVDRRVPFYCPNSDIEHLTNSEISNKAHQDLKRFSQAYAGTWVVELASDAQKTSTSEKVTVPEIEDTDEIPF